MLTGPADAAKESIITPIFGRAPKADKRTSAAAHKPASVWAALRW